MKCENRARNRAEEIEQKIQIWDFGILGFWDFGILGFWDFGILGFFWDFGILGFLQILTG